MAATSIGQIGLDLVVNENRFQAQMSGIGNTARRAANTLQNQIQPQLEGITGMAKKAGMALGAAFGVKKIVDFGKQCLELGSDLAEVQNVVDVTFPSMTAQVDKFAKNAAQSFGLSETMAKQYTGTFGAMAKAFGFTEQQAYDMGSTLTGLAGDVASFYNLSQDEAYTKIKSVFTGETESLKDLGVVMTQTALDSYALANGFGKTTSAMTEAEKVALRYRFVQDQLSAAQGDFARTSDSWANQCRILSLQLQSLMATIGQGLINLFAPVIKVINTVIGKLATLANAFKSFTELITGNKSSGTDSEVSAIAGAAGDATEGLDSASDSASNLAGNTDKVGQAAQNAAKKMKALMGFDKINKLDSQSDTTSSGSSPSSSTGGAGALGNAVDFGSLAKGDTVLDKTDEKLSALQKRCQELAKLFKKGFEIGFGDSQKKIDSINKSVKNIGKNLKEIFTDQAVVNAANRCGDNIALAFGKITGSTARIGLTLADNLIGGVDKYLSKSKNYIKKRIVSLFDVTTDIVKLSGDFAVAVADIFDVFSGDDAKAITGDFIQAFADAFLGIADLALKFKRDFISLFTVPIIQNVDKISTTLENVQSRWRIVFDALAQSVTDTFDKINQVYDQYVKPFIDSITQGISDILGVFLDAYNTYISPVLDQLAERFGTVWSEHVQPAINGFLELVGKVFENLQALWETLLKPFVEWIINTIVPILAPIIASIGDQILSILQVASDVFTGIMEILGGFLDFCTGAFKGDFGKCWQGIEEIFQGFKTIAAGIFEYLKTTVFQPFIDFIKNIFTTDWSQSFGTLGKIMNTFLSGVRQMWNNAKKIFNGIVDFIAGTFSGNWEQAWNGIKDIFGGIFDNLVTLAKTPLNMVIDIINSLMEKINSGLSAIESAFSFNYDFTNPITGTRHYGHYGMSLPRVPEIPHLADGGYVKPNTPQLAMIGDNLHQGEVVAPEDKLKKMAIEAAMAAGNRGVSRDELESIINRAVMRIVSALASMGFYLDSTQIANAQREAMTVMDIRNNTVEVR
jgi:phage-related protein